MLKTITIINGPNLNLLGKREPHLYGAQSLADINAKLEEIAQKLGVALVFRQSNIEGELVDFIQAAEKSAGLIINAGAYTHTSLALRDALLSVGLPFIEVHLSNLDKREEFRKTSYLSDLASGVIYGFGPDGYELALYGLVKNLAKKE